MTQKAGEDLFFFFGCLAGVFVKLKPPLIISRSATDKCACMSSQVAGLYTVKDLTT